MISCTTYIYHHLVDPHSTQRVNFAEDSTMCLNLIQSLTTDSIERGQVLRVDYTHCLLLSFSIAFMPTDGYFSRYLYSLFHVQNDELSFEEGDLLYVTDMVSITHSVQQIKVKFP